MNSKLLVCLLLCLLAVANAKKTHSKEHHGPVYSSKKYQKLLHSLLKDNENAAPVLLSVKTLIQTKETGYQKIHDIGDKIGNLYSILVQDQANDDAQFAADTKRINDAIDVENQQITSLRSQRQVLRDKLTALKVERAKIEGIYQGDRTAYKQRVATQSELAQVLDELILQATNGLLDNPIVPGLDNTNVSQVLAQVKKVGRGRPIEALIQLTNLFNKQDASDIITRFTNLQTAVYESMRIDTQKEDANLDLYNVLSNDIDNVLIPQTETQIAALNDQIKVHKANIVVLQKQLADITSIYNQTKAERANAINYTTQASTELKDEVAKLDAAGANIQ